MTFCVPISGRSRCWVTLDMTFCFPLVDVPDTERNMHCPLPLSLSLLSLSLLSILSLASTAVCLVVVVVVVVYKGFSSALLLQHTTTTAHPRFSCFSLVSNFVLLPWACGLFAVFFCHDFFFHVFFSPRLRFLLLLWQDWYQFVCIYSVRTLIVLICRRERERERERTMASLLVVMVIWIMK
jgi:hypothetical protein